MGTWEWPWDPPAHSDQQVIGLLRQINRKVDLIMTAQDDINADVTVIQNDESTIAAAVTAIQAYIATLQQAGIDTGPLDAAVASLTTAAQSVAAIPPAPAAPTEEPPA